MDSKRQKTQSQQQMLLAFAQEGRSESPMACEEGTVLPAADSTTESPTSSDRLMESICDPENLNTAMAKVIANGGAPGIDGMRVKELKKYSSVTATGSSGSFWQERISPNRSTRGDSQTRRWSAKAWHSDGGGSRDPTGDSLGAVTAVG